MNSVKTFRIASSRAQCYPLSPGKTPLPLLSHRVSYITPYSLTSLIYDQLPIRTFVHFRQRTKPPRNRRCLSTAPDTDPLRRTALYNLHVENKATMVPFGGYSMPVRYADLNISESHHWTRNKASLFDVGHMYGANTFVNVGGERLNPMELGSNITSKGPVQCVSSKN